MRAPPSETPSTQSFFAFPLQLVSMVDLSIAKFLSMEFDDLQRS